MSDALALLRTTLAGRDAWLVGGSVRDAILGRDSGAALGRHSDSASGHRSGDFDVIVADDPAPLARALARAAGRAASFALSEDFGAWRVVARDGTWQIDLERMRGATVQEDLRQRDLTINAIAQPLAGGEPIDPLGGLADLRERRLRMVAAQAFQEDPLRVLRLVRIAVELDFAIEPRTLRTASEAAAALHRVAGERVFAELSRILAAPRAVQGIELMGEVKATAAVLPELQELRGVQQSRYHHRDVYGHTLEVLEQTIALQRDPHAILDTGRERRPRERTGGSRERGDGKREDSADLGDEVAALLVQPLADGLTRGEALRWGALLHDIAKPATRATVPFSGRVTFMGHDTLGAQLAHELLGRLRVSERLRAYVAALVQHHLRLGFLVHEPQPLARETVFTYLHTCEPVEVDVTLLSVADRLATRGAKAQEAIAAHMALARAMLADALRWRAAGGAPKPLWRGDELARELGIPEGPRLGELLAELARAQYVGDVRTSAQALDFARAKLEGTEKQRGPARRPGHR
jgi:poly(A) polymerase